MVREFRKVKKYQIIDDQKIDQVYSLFIAKDKELDKDLGVSKLKLETYGSMGDYRHCIQVLLPTCERFYDLG